MPKTVLRFAVDEQIKFVDLRFTDLLGAWIMHFVIGWIFLIGAVFKLPEKTNENPFDQTSREAEPELEEPKKKNPFER